MLLQLGQVPEQAFNEEERDVRIVRNRGRSLGDAGVVGSGVENDPRLRLKEGVCRQGEHDIEREATGVTPVDAAF